MKFDFKTEPEFFYIDYPQHVRLTHWPSGASVMRAYYQLVDRQDEWEDNLVGFLARFPDAHAIVTYDGKMLDNADDFPQRGGAYEIGDTIMINERDHGMCADVIVGLVTDEAMVDHPNHPKVVYQLESGNQLYWSGDRDMWVSTSKTAFERRARRPVEGENVETLEEKIAGRIRYGY